jgi:hypothetical protein
MTRWSAITRTRGRRSALAYGSRSTTAAEDNLNRLVHHHRGRYYGLEPSTPSYHGGSQASRAYTHDHPRHSFACKSGL